MTRSADKARDFRAREAIRQSKDRQRETFDVHASGRALLAHPKMGTSVGGGTVPPAVTVTTPGNVNLGQHVELTATGDSIASGGDYITWGTIADQSGFGGVTAAGASITLPNAAEYTVDLWVGWSSYLLGGTVALELDGVIVHTFDGPTSVGQFFHGSWSVKGAASGVLKVRVTQSSGSAQTCDARVRVTLHDPSSGTVPGDLPSVSSYTTGNTAGNSLTFNVPTVVSGQLLVLYVGGMRNFDSTGLTTPSGWTKLVDNATGVATPAATYYKIADGTETTVNVATTDASVTWYLTGLCIVIDKAAASPIDVYATNTTPISVTTTVDDTLLLMVASRHANGGATNPTLGGGMSDEITGGFESTGAGHVFLQFDSVEQASAGASGSYTVGGSGTLRNTLIAIKGA